ncbi:hypothetical protein STRDD13_00467 [Streptococcus sp. DD13]|nr:hypothetical protein STRDD13_00467 [Streptococcus sp. DD13]
MSQYQQFKDLAALWGCFSMLFTEIVKVCFSFFQKNGVY